MNFLGLNLTPRIRLVNRAYGLNRGKENTNQPNSAAEKKPKMQGSSRIPSSPSTERVYVLFLSSYSPELKITAEEDLSVDRID
jgi:hypothetical protein